MFQLLLMLEVQTEINPCPTRVPPNNNYKLKSTHVQPVDWVGSRGSPKPPVAIFLRWKEYLSCQTRPKWGEPPTDLTKKNQT
jgi:hypothetical protein